MTNYKGILDNLNKLSTMLIAIFVVITAYNTNNLKANIDSIKVNQDEGVAVNKFISDLTQENNSTVKYDYSFLALERYLKNTGEKGKLKIQDKEMLVGFAKTLIYDRINQNSLDSLNIINRLNIPTTFLEKNDSIALTQIKTDVNTKFRLLNLPKNIPIDNDFKLLKPVSEFKDALESKTVTVLMKKLIYIQFSNKIKKDEVKAIQDKLKSKAWFAPGVEFIPGNYQNTIRYFHDEDWEIANQANKILEEKYVIIKVKSYENKVPKGQIELWINNN